MEIQKEFSSSIASDKRDVAPADQSNESVRGRAVFSVEMSAAGLVVRTAFLTEQNRVLEMPAVFPDLQYALAQIDSLRQLVFERFAQAAQVGIQVMAAQAAAGSAPQEDTAKTPQIAPQPVPPASLAASTVVTPQVTATTAPQAATVSAPRVPTTTASSSIVGTTPSSLREPGSRLS
jgi:hypothetical protein